MKRKLLSFLALVFVVAMAIVPMLAIMASAAEEAPALEITTADFNSTSYAANNTTKTENGYSYTSYQVMYQNSVMQWKKNEGYITISTNDFNKIEMNVTGGSFTVTVGGTAVTAAKNGTVYTYDLTGKTGEIKISVGSATGKTTYINFYAAPAASACEHEPAGEGVETLAPGKETTGIMTYTCGKCGETYEVELPALGYVASFVVPEGAAVPENKSGLKVEMPEEAVAAPDNFNMYEYSFVGWATSTIDGETTEAPTLYKAGDEVKLTADTTFYAVYMRAEGGSGESGWIATDIANIKATDEVVIVWTKGDASYAIKNATVSSKPGAVSVTIKDGKISGDPADNIKWNVTYNNGDIKIKSNSSEAYLTYGSSTTMKVATGSGSTFVINGNYLQVKNGRHIGIYNNQDLRAYDGEHANIAGQTVAFYVLTENGVAYYSTTLLEDSGECQHTNTTTTTVDATCTEKGSITVTCNDCPKQISFEEIPALEHDYDNGVILEGDEATCTKVGTKTFTCQRKDCGHSYTEDVPVIPHNYVDDVCDMCGKIDPASVDYSGEYYFAALREDVWFYIMGEMNGTRYNIFSTDLADCPASITDAEDIYTFVIEKNDDGTYCIYAKAIANDAKYLGWTSGNVGSFVTADKALKVSIDAIEGGLYNIHFAASDAERYLAVNGTDYNYAAWYKSGQKQDLALIPVEEKPAVTEPEFTGASIVIGADLAVKYYVVLPEGEVIGDYAVKFTMNGKSVVVTDCAEVNGEYVFVFTNIGPQCMGDTILAELVKDDVTVATKDGYSIKAYAQNKLNDSESSAAFKQLLTDLLYYGAAAQKHQSYKVDALVNEGVENIGTPSTITPTDADNALDGAASTDDTREIKSAGVKFDYDNKLYVKFIAPSLDGIVVKVGGEVAEIVDLEDGTYQVYSEGILATQFGEAVTFELIYNDVTLQTVTYSIDTYAFNKYNNSATAENAELALAMYRYGKSAVAYAAEK